MQNNVHFNFQPTEDYGAECGESSSNDAYLSNCSFPGARVMLSHIYPSEITNPGDVPPKLENFYDFDQAEFLDSINSTGLADTGFIYIPDNCGVGSTTTCKLHMVFHGCSGNR